MVLSKKLSYLPYTTVATIPAFWGVPPLNQKSMLMCVD